MRLENWLYTIPLRLRSLLARNRQDRDLEEELRDHIARQTEENQARGMNEEEARLAALRAFGNFVRVREQTHESWAWAATERLWQDFRRAGRSARRAPLLSSVAVLALALGIGLNTGVFAIINTLFLRVPTRVDPASFVQICPRYEGWFAGSDKNASFTTEDFDAIRTRSRTLSQVAVWRQYYAFLEQANRNTSTLLASCNFFYVLGIDHPRMGRFFVSAECNRGAAAQVAVLSETLWKSQFDADPQIVGKAITLNGLPVTIIGVAPSGAANLLLGGIFLPYTLAPQLDHSGDLLDNQDNPWLSMSGRLHPGFTRIDAQAELTAIMSQQDRAYVQRKVFAFNRKTSLVVTDGSEIENPAIHDLASLMMMLMMGPLALILLLACSNVATLFLSRTIARKGEIAVRLALGVSRSRLAGMLLMESLLTVCIGAAGSMVLAYRVPIMIMNTLVRDRANFAARFEPDWRVLAYLMILMTAATVLSSIMPIRAAWKLDLLTALKGRETTATVRSRATSGLIVTQIALGFVLVCAAVIFVRMPGLIRGANPGFEIHQLLTVPLHVATSEGNRAKAQVFYRTLETKILALPGVQSLAYASLPPFNQSPPDEIRLPHQAKGAGRAASVDEVSGGFFSAFGIPVLRGRPFLSSDITSTGAAPVAVVSRAFANEFWPGSDPVGQKIVMPDDRYLTVAGVVADTRAERFGRLDGPRLYTLRAPSSLDGDLYVRFVGSAKPLENAIRQKVQNLDPAQIIGPQTIWEALEEQAESMVTMAKIILAVASIALLMAVTGIYCVLSFAVNQQKREFGIKMVLGATRAEIFRLVLVRAAQSIAIGLIGGITLAEPAMLLLNRLLAQSPFPLHHFDSAVFATSALMLTAVSLAASYIPASRAMRTDPMQTLRTE